MSEAGESEANEPKESAKREPILTPKLRTKVEKSKSAIAPVLMVAGGTITAMGVMGKHQVVYDAIWSVLNVRMIPVAMLMGGLFVLNNVVSNPQAQRLLTSVNVLIGVGAVFAMYRYNTFDKINEIVEESQNG